MIFPKFCGEIELKSGKKISAKLIIDTGSGHPVSLEKMDGIPFELPDERILGNLGVGLTGPIGGFIGLEIIKSFNVVFDYNRTAMYVKPITPLKESFEHDMAGIEIGSVGENYKRLIITRVEPSSAAEQAGLIKVDEILAINFKPASEMSLSEIDIMLRSRTGRSFVINVAAKDGKGKERVILTLKKII